VHTGGDFADRRPPSAVARRSANLGPMQGKTVVITGATAGIGKAAALELARLGASLSLVARNPEKAKAVVDELVDAVPGAAVRVFRADLAELADVRRVAGEILEALPRIDVLINNAGVAATAPRVTADGFDEMLAANYLGPFLLTELLVDRLLASAPARIVITGSEAHRVATGFAPERIEDLGQYTNPVAAQLAYGRTKLLDMLWADELARRLDGTGVTVNSLCPGLVATDLARELGASDRFFKALAVTPFVRRPDQGARVVVKVASDPALEGVTGRFYSSTPGAGFMPTTGPRRQPEVAATVYERTRAAVGLPDPRSSAP
jgi:retinol dehydrogenase-12